ncbi:MAG: CHAT domain-containing protein [Phormidesmis sp. RL_2_1]|nr:CHAT domain-containing protein [Phormidesmis sp. RL_2_1]
MRRPRFRFRARHTFTWLCGLTLLLTVCLGLFSNQPQFVAKANDSQQLVQTGVNQYEAGNFSGAIEPWLSAYTVYETTQDLPALAIVSENLARAYQQMGQTSTELDYWERAIATTQTLGNGPKLGRLLSEQAQAYSRLGQHRRAIALLCGTEADENSTTVGGIEVRTGAQGTDFDPDDRTCQIGSALQIAEAEEDAVGQIAALGSLGEAYRLSGDTETALRLIERGLEISRLSGEVDLESALLSSLGSTSVSSAQVNYRRASAAEARGDGAAATFRTTADDYNSKAIEHFQASYQLARSQQSATAQMQALLSLIPAHERANNQSAAEQQWQIAAETLGQLPDSQAKAFAAIKLADFLEPLSVRELQTVLNTTPPSQTVESTAVDLLKQALRIGEILDNPRIVSFALGKLGNIDERAGRYELALEKTQQARLAADQGLAGQDSLYLLDWQMGRILREQGNLTDAAQSYQQAVNLLSQIRSDILNANRDLQFDFRDTVEPIYRQYAQLNLQAVPSAVTLRKGEQAFAELDTTLETLDSLKVAELQSYFANDCVIAPVATRVDAVGDSQATAVLSTAILDAEGSLSTQQNSPQPDDEFQQLAVIVSLPDGSKKVVQTPVNSQAVEQTIKAFRDTLELGGSQYISEYQYAPSQQLYDWLIKPFEADLADVKTLVFVNDGLLRSVPMAALYDGQQYLIEKFAIATTPSLTLTDPKKISRPTTLSALLMGVSERPEVEGRPFNGLPAVADELVSVAAKLPDSKVLLNEAFSVSALKAALAEKDYRILHMATHGTFGFDPTDNYLVAGAKSEAGDFNETLTISDLDALIREVSGPTREPIELLTLTACETAIGDNRSTLGLAGVAIRAGVRSAIATLWSVSDSSSADLISQFYDNLQSPDMTKAEALRQAQISMIRSDDFVEQHPYRWAPFTLIGNWL